MNEVLAGADLSQATVLAALVFANAAGILGAYVSMRERVKVLEYKVDDLGKDTDSAHEKIREIEKEKKEK